MWLEAAILERVTSLVRGEVYTSVGKQEARQVLVRHEKTLHLMMSDLKFRVMPESSIEYTIQALPGELHAMIGAQQNCRELNTSSATQHPLKLWCDCCLSADEVVSGVEELVVLQRRAAMAYGYLVALAAATSRGGAGM